MIKDAKFIAEKFKVSKKLMSEAVKLQTKKKLNEQDEKDKVTFKFEFVGVAPGDTQKILLKFNSPALSLALMNNKAKGGNQKYAYLLNFINIAKNSLQTQTGINPLQFESTKSSMGDLIFSANRELAKTDLSQLVQLQSISVVVKVSSGEATQPQQMNQPVPKQPEQPTKKQITPPKAPTPAGAAPTSTKPQTAGE